MAKIPTYMGGTGIKAPRIDKGLAGNKTGAWLSVFAGAFKAVESFDFVWKERADEKKAESVAALNTLWLNEENLMGQAYRDAAAANDPMGYQKATDARGKAFKAELDRGVEEERWSQEQANEYFAKLITRQTQDGRLIDQAYVREDQDRKNAEAKAVHIRAQGSSMERGSLFASEDPQEQGLAAAKQLEAIAALRDPQGPAMSQGPEAVELAVHDLKAEDEENTIYSLASSRIAQGGDPSDIVEGLRIKGRVQLPSGLMTGMSLRGDTQRTIADNIERQYAAAQRKKQQTGNATADGNTDDGLQAQIDAMDTWRMSDGSPAAIASFIRDWKAAGGTDAAGRAELEKIHEPSSWQAGNERALRPEFAVALDSIEMNANGRVDGFFEGRDLVNDWEARGIVSENWATDRRNELRSRRDKLAELGTSALVPSNTAANLKGRLSKMLRTQGGTPEAQTYAARTARYMHPTRPVTAGSKMGFAEDLQRRSDIESAFDLAIAAGIEPTAAFDLATGSAHAGANGQLLRFVAAHASGTEGIKGVQKVAREDPDVFVSFFSNVVSQRDRLVRTAAGGIDVEGTAQAIRSAAADRAVNARGGTVFQRRAAGPATAAERERALTDQDWLLIDFLREYQGLLSYTAPPSAADKGAAAQLEAQALSLQHKQAQAAGATP